MVKYIECSARKKKNLKAFEEAIYIAVTCGENPLHAAAWFGNKDKVKLLLRQEVNVNVKKCQCGELKCQGTADPEVMKWKDDITLSTSSSPTST